MRTEVAAAFGPSAFDAKQRHQRADARAHEIAVRLSMRLAMRAAGVTAGPEDKSVALSTAACLWKRGAPLRAKSGRPLGHRETKAFGQAPGPCGLGLGVRPSATMSGRDRRNLWNHSPQHCPSNSCGHVRTVRLRRGTRI